MRDSFWKPCIRCCTPLDLEAAYRRYAPNTLGKLVKMLTSKSAARRRFTTWLSAFALAAILPLGTARAASIPVAVAANFTAPAKELAANFQLATGNSLVLSFG